MVEALIDFGEGEDIEEGVYAKAQAEAQSLLATIHGHLRDSKRGEILRTGIRLAIFGPPNAGKSSLLNFLAQREAAIVTSVPGTTRDIIELSLDIDGLPVIVSDTAGLRKTDDIVENIGIERTKKAVQAADVSLCVLSMPELASSGVSPTSIASLPTSVASLVTPHTYFLLNKSDALGSSLLPLDDDSCIRKDVIPKAWEVSLQTGEGTDQFLAGFAKSLKAKYDILKDEQDGRCHPLITQSRHRVHLESAAKFLEAFIATPQEDVVLGAEELRYAAQAVGKISGLIDIEEILDAVFKDFCIGK
ncbi:hypothetical protein ONZ45_g5461 [Pleurotus djamor]|nr:hypothetical protein ONZ45_g5461 [Pleurotus djamor]